MNEMAQLYIDTAKAYDHSAIFVHPNPSGVEATQWLLELIREKSGDEYYIMMHGAPTCSIPYLFIGGIHTAFAWWVSGIPFDMIHGVSNFVLMLVLYKPLRRVLEHCVVRK